MSDLPSSTAPVSRPWWRIPLRLGMVLALALAAGVGVNRIGTAVEHSKQPAGFGRGALQGALMPMALPNLLFGQDVAIYTQNNAGVSYKLGYTVGVNACGAVFFGFFFWRLNRLRRWAMKSGR